MKTLVDLLRYAIVLACAVTLPNSIGRLRLSSQDPRARTSHPLQLFR
jgi:hypothetical protein